MRTLFLILATLFTSPLLASGHDLSPSSPAGHQILPVVTGNGSGFMAAWKELAPSHNILSTQAVSANGEPIAGGGTSGDQPPVYSMAISHSPSDALLAWTLDGYVFAKRLSPSGMVLSTTLITFGPGYRSDIAVAWSGSRYFVMWTTTAQLFGAFVEADGSATTPRAFSANRPRLDMGRTSSHSYRKWPGTASTSSSCSPKCRTALVPLSVPHLTQTVFASCAFPRMERSSIPRRSSSAACICARTSPRAARSR